MDTAPWMWISGVIMGVLVSFLWADFRATQKLKRWQGEEIDYLRAMVVAQGEDLDRNWEEANDGRMVRTR